VNSSRVFSLVVVVGLALLVTVPLKLADFGAARPLLSRSLHQAIVAMLTNEGFSVKNGDIFGYFVVDAQHDNCHLQLREAPAYGNNVDAIKMASKDARLEFAYRGELSDSHPTLRATVLEIWNRFKWYLKIDNSWSPVVSVAAKGACGIAALPWQRIATIRLD
jgi:hypothetical protein